MDVAIDFSIAAAVPENVERLAALGVPMVVGTTGWHEALPRVRAAVERQDGALLHGANFSVGVQVFYRLAEAASRLLAEETDYEAWLYEIHHSQQEGRPVGHPAADPPGDGGGGIRAGRSTSPATGQARSPAPIRSASTRRLIPSPSSTPRAAGRDSRRALSAPRAG